MCVQVPLNCVCSFVLGTHKYYTECHLAHIAPFYLFIYLFIFLLFFFLVATLQYDYGDCFGCLEAGMGVVRVVMLEENKFFIHLF